MRRRLIALAGAVVAAALLLPLTHLVAQAHGIGQPRVLNEPAGPYMLSVWTDPIPLRADETHVVVAVIEPETREMIVAGVEVVVTMIPVTYPAGAQRMAAGKDNANQLLYAAVFNDRVTEGVWRVVVQAIGERGTSDEVTFEVEVGPARTSNWLWIGIGSMSGMSLLWVALSMQPETRSRAARRRRRPPPRPGRPSPRQ